MGQEVGAMFHMEVYERSRHPLGKPTWWLLYAIWLFLVAGVGMLEWFLPAGGGRTALECGVVVVAFGLTQVWRRCNRARWT
jgi:hypothetical protein